MIQGKRYLLRYGTFRDYWCTCTSVEPNGDFKVTFDATTEVNDNGFREKRRGGRYSYPASQAGHFISQEDFEALRSREAKFEEAVNAAI